jgi:hypothetical protein
MEKLKNENLAFQEKYDMLLYSNENLMDDHIILNIAHEVVIKKLKIPTTSLMHMYSN